MDTAALVEELSHNSIASWRNLPGRRRGQSCTFFRHFPFFTAEKVRTDPAPDNSIASRRNLPYEDLVCRY